MRITPQKTRRGFTIVEILVVVAIIALLIAILIPTIGSVKKNAKKAKTTAELTNIRNALNAYAQDFDGQFPASGPVPANWTTGGIPTKCGAAMLAEGLNGYLDYTYDGAGPSNTNVGTQKDPLMGFRTRNTVINSISQGKIYGPYATQDPAEFKAQSNGGKAVYTFIDAYGNDILYFRSNFVGSNPSTAPTNIFGPSGATTAFFVSTDNDNDALGNVRGQTDPASSMSQGFGSLLGSTNTNNVTGPVMGSDGFLLVSGGEDGKFYSNNPSVTNKCDDIVLGNR